MLRTSHEDLCLSLGLRTSSADLCRCLDSTVDVESDDWAIPIAIEVNEPTEH